MGQPRKNVFKVGDLEGSEWLCERIWEIAEEDLFQKIKRLRLDSFLAVPCQSCLIEVSTAPDGNAPPTEEDGQRGMIRLSIRSWDSGQVWQFWVRYSKSVDQVPPKTWSKISSRTMRKAFHPHNVPPGSLDTQMGKTQDCYIHEDLKTEDLVAQLLVYLLQIKVLQKTGKDDAAEWLLGYLKKNFSLRERGVESDVVEHLISHWRWPESWKAWRQYVSTTLRHLTPKPMLGLDDLDQPDILDQSTLDDQSRKQMRPRKPERGGQLDDSLTAKRVAELTGIGVDYVWKLRRKGKLKSAGTNDDGLEIFTQESVDAFLATRTAKAQRIQLIRKYQEEGLSEEAARKKAYRQLKKKQE